LSCPAGYDPAHCFAQCQQALAGASCGAKFEAALVCLITQGRAKCADTGAPMLMDSDHKCTSKVDAYADCVASG
jgi:hypothetical protein